MNPWWEHSSCPLSPLNLPQPRLVLWTSGWRFNPKACWELLLHIPVHRQECLFFRERPSFCRLREKCHSKEGTHKEHWDVSDICKWNKWERGENSKYDSVDIRQTATAGRKADVSLSCVSAWLTWIFPSPKRGFCNWTGQNSLSAKGHFECKISWSNLIVASCFPYNFVLRKLETD